MKNFLQTLVVLIFLLTACNLPSKAPVDISIETTAAMPTVMPTETAANPTPVPPTETPIPPTATPTNTLTPIPVVESLDATVTADLLSCRYGPGAEYLFFDGFKKGLKLKLTGRTDGNNWVMVTGNKSCWINAKFVEIKGDPQTLKVTYPGEYKLPVSPYYAPPTVLSAVRDPNNPREITVKWTDITLRAGDEEDENMFIYIVEVWRCEDGKTIFDPLASNYPEVTFIDEASCDVPSHGRVFFQEKHGFAGPADIPWPEQ